VNERELLLDCLRRLNRTGVAYFLTGSMASNYWGIPRTTHDLDFVIQLPPSAVDTVVREFASDFYVDPIAIRQAYKPPHQFNLIDNRSALKVDFWLLKNEPFEREMFNRRIQVQIGGEPATIGTAEDILLHKLLWNAISPSERQIGDAAGIFAIQRDSLDRAYLERWAEILNVKHQLFDILSGKSKPKTT